MNSLGLHMAGFQLWLAGPRIGPSSMNYRTYDEPALSVSRPLLEKLAITKFSTAGMGLLDEPLGMRVEDLAVTRYHQNGGYDCGI